MSADHTSGKNIAVFDIETGEGSPAFVFSQTSEPLQATRHRWSDMMTKNISKSVITFYPISIHRYLVGKPRVNRYKLRQQRRKNETPLWKNDLGGLNISIIEMESEKDFCRHMAYAPNRKHNRNISVPIYAPNEGLCRSGIYGDLACITRRLVSASEGRANRDYGYSFTDPSSFFQAVERAIREILLNKPSASARKELLAASFALRERKRMYELREFLDKHISHLSQPLMSEKHL